MKRNRVEIILAILEACSSGATKTEVVYKANLNFKTANCYLKPLVKENLVEICVETPALYRTTPKGYRIADELKKVWDELSKLNDA